MSEIMFSATSRFVRLVSEIDKRMSVIAILIQY